MGGLFFLIDALFNFIVRYTLDILVWQFYGYVVLRFVNYERCLNILGHRNRVLGSKEVEV